VGSSNQNETRKEHRLRDMPPLGPMQKKSRVSEKIVGLGYFSTNLGFVQVLFVWAKQNYFPWDRLRSHSNFVSLKACA